MLGIVGVIAELEIETTKARTQAGRAEAVKNGVVMGSTPIYGYIKDKDKLLVVLEEEAKIVRMIFDMFVNEKRTTQQITDYLTNSSIPSPDASAVLHNKRKGEIKKKHSLYFWRAEKIREILSNENYIGEYYYNKSLNGKLLDRSEWKLSPYKQPNIIDTFIFAKAQHLLQQAKQMANAKYKVADNHVYLLSGLLKCDCCKGATDNDVSTWTGDWKKLVYANSTTTYAYSYKCGRKKIKKNPTICRAIPIPAAPLEEYILNLARELLKNPQSGYKYQQELKSTQLEIKYLRNKREEIKGLLNSLPARLENIKEQHELGFIDREKLLEKSQELTKSQQKYKEELEKLEFRIADSELSNGYIATLKLFSEKYTKALDDLLTNRQELFDILHMLIDKIVVYSRGMTVKDKIAGRKKKEQQIPYRLEVELKLPQDMLNELATRFEVKTFNL